MGVARRPAITPRTPRPRPLKPCYPPVSVKVNDKLVRNKLYTLLHQLLLNATTRHSCNVRAYRLAVKTELKQVRFF